MSTTNPPAGPNNPGGDAPRPITGEAPGAGPNWPRDVGYGHGPDDHGGGGGVNPASVAAGHEPDAFAVKPIMGIPLAVVIAFVIAFTVAAGAFAYFRGEAGKPVPFAHPDAVARSAEGTNERLDRIEREGLRPNTHREVDQPRLEPLKRLEGDGMFYARPAMPTGNSPEIHPEEIHPSRVAGLHVAGYVGPDKKTARIPIDEAMRLAVADQALLPARKDASKPVGTDRRPSASNGGVGVQPPLPKADEKAGKEEPKKGADGKPEPAPMPKPKPPEPAPKPPEKK